MPNTQKEVDDVAEAIQNSEKPSVTTYIATALEVIEKMKADNAWTAEKEDGILILAKYLDSFNGLSKDLVILAYQQSSKINREIMLGLVDQLPAEVVESVVRKVTNSHKHKKVRAVSNGAQV